MIDQLTVNVAVYAALIGAIVATALEVVPGLAGIWARFKFKPLVLFILCTGVPVTIAVLGCYYGVQVGVAYICSPEGEVHTVIIAIIQGLLVFTSSQFTYMAISKRDIRNKARKTTT